MLASERKVLYNLGFGTNSHMGAEKISFAILPSVGKPLILIQTLTPSNIDVWLPQKTLSAP